MNMKNKLFYLLLIIPLFIGLAGCEKEETKPNGPPPVADGLTTSLSTKYGEEVVFTGTVTDELGLSSIRITYADWFLDKIITLTDEPTSYTLNYKFAVPDDATPGTHTFVIATTNTSEKTVTADVIVTVANPVPTGNVYSPISTAPGGEITFSGSIKDRAGLSDINIVYSTWSLNETINLTDHPLTYSLEHNFVVPEDAPTGNHTVMITATNIYGETVELPVVVEVTTAPKVYDNIWIAGGFQWSAWNPERAYLMLQDPTDDQWFEILVHAWGDGADELKFLGQLNWTPDNWGLVDRNDPSQGMLNSDGSDVVVLGAGSGNPSYFKVRFNPYTMNYTSEEVVIEEPVQTEMYIVGSGFPGFPDQNWSPEAGIAMTPNPYGYGENLFLIEGLEFSDDVSLKFIGQNTGWEPLDIGFDDSYIVDEDPDAGGYQVTAPVSWLPAKSGSGTADLKFVNQAGTYTVLYDHNAKRALIWKE